MVQRNLKKLLFLMLLMLGVGQAAQATVELTFTEKESGVLKAYVYPVEMEVTGMTLDETGVLTKSEAGPASIILDFGDVDFSHVTNITVDVDYESDGYTNLVGVAGENPGKAVLSNQEGEVHSWSWSVWSYDLNDYDRTNGRHMKSFVLNMRDDAIGSMKINHICITKPKITELEFDEEGKAYIYPEDMIVTGMTLDPETGLLVKTDETKQGNILISLGDVDFSDVTRIDVNVDTESEGYVDLFETTCVRSIESNINTWYGSKYGIDYTTTYQEKSEHVKEIQMYTVNPSPDLTPADKERLTGSMKINYICITKVEKPLELIFNEAGKSYIFPEDLKVTGMTYDSGTGVLTKEAGTSGSILINLGDADFSNVARITLSGDWSNDDHTDLLSRTIVKGLAGENIATANFQKYDFDYTEYQSKGNVSGILLEFDADKAGSMKINNLCITKNMLYASPSSEVGLYMIPYMVKGNDGTWSIGTPDWNVALAEQATIYGSGSSDPVRYADVSEYDELHIYQTSGEPVRLFFIDNNNSAFTVNTTSEPALVVGENYSTLDLAAITEKFGAAKLIGIKASASWTTATVEKIVAIKSNPVADYVIAGKDGEISEFAATVLLDANATVIDVRGVVEPLELNSANPNCLFIANEGILDQSNVLVKGEGDVYTCQFFDLQSGYPFRAPFNFTAAVARMQKTIEAGFATLVLPYTVNNVTAGKVYGLTNVNGTVVNGKLVTTIEANRPVLLSVGNYDLNASDVFIEANPASMTNGVLTGVYDATTPIPEGSYVLQNQTNKDGWAFYYVNENSGDYAIKMTPFTAYLSNSGNQANVNMLTFNFDDEVTGVENVEAVASATTVVEIYDLSGRKVNAPMKGINLMKMSDGTVKKVIVK